MISITVSLATSGPTVIPEAFQTSLAFRPPWKSAANTGQFQPYNTNNQDVRTRYWDGKDSMYRDDVTWIKGNHLFQLGGLYQRNNDTHNRNDNGETINTFEQYISRGGQRCLPCGLRHRHDRLHPHRNHRTATRTSTEISTQWFSAWLTRLRACTPAARAHLRQDCPSIPRTLAPFPVSQLRRIALTSPPLTNDSIIPTYNGYFTDAWHIKPTFSLNYGLGYTVEMPPFNTNGGYQTVMVDQNNHILYAENYLNSVKAAALQGNVMLPLLASRLLTTFRITPSILMTRTSADISPRIGFAWNLRPDTVIRGGYSRIFGRINGVNPILVPMLTPGLMQPATCGGPTISGQCGVGPGATGLATPANVFRVGVDGVNAPLPPPSADLPQPWYPGFNDVATGAGETIDPNYHPDRSDEFTLSIQHQFGPKILAEVGYIGRIIGNMGQYYSLTAVPYMMTRGGQSFANAWANVMVATNYGTNLTNIPVQPFFENALTPAYCNIGSGTGQFSSCTAAFVNNNAGLMNVSDAFDAWGGVSNAGGFAFGRSFTSDPIAATCVGGVGNGCSGQSPSILTTVSNGYGNYNAGYLQLSTTNWHGLTAHTNFQYSNALGTGAVVQATSSFATVDPWNLQNAYGPQSYNEKFVFNLFLNYAEPFFTSQQGIVGHLLGGWNFAPNFVYGSGFPIELGTANFDCGSFGECNTNYVGAQENGIIVQNLRYSGTEKPGYGTVCGTGGAGYNVFSNPDATCAADAEGIFGDPVRSPILGYDGQIGGGGPLKGLPFWNLDMGITKNIKIKERLSGSLYFDFTNVLNHMQPNDPSLNIFDPTDWGVLGGGGPLQGNTPRQLQLGLSFDW